MEALEEGDDVDMDESGSSSDEDEAEAPMEEDTAPLRPGLGLSTDPPESKRGGIGSSNTAGLGSRAGLGAAPRAGLGAQTQAQTEAPARQPRSFLPATMKPDSPRPATPLTNDEKRHFAQLEKKGGIGFKLLAKMGWTAGTGLGAEQEGRINPVDQQLRPKGMGIGHGGFKEKSKLSVQEAKRCVHPSAAIAKADSRY
jgi:tuftelin-interacting protein 11